MASIDEMLRVQRIIHSALMTSVVVYGLIGYVTGRAPSGAPLPPAMLYTLGGVALVVMVQIPFLRRRLLAPAEPTSSAPARPAMVRLFNGQILTWALCEAIALFGLILTLMAHDLRYVLGFGALSLLNFFIYRPTAALIEDVMRGDRP
jgi:F0F1-type ATP synthase membrane subunit c/vacuolar-type H+-ATPase subunit K